MSFLRLVMAGALLAACASAEKSGAPKAKPTRELAAGAAQIRGGGVRMDVQIGRGLTNQPGTAGAVQIAPHATVSR